MALKTLILNCTVNIAERMMMVLAKKDLMMMVWMLLMVILWILMVILIHVVDDDTCCWWRYSLLMAILDTWYLLFVVDDDTLNLDGDTWYLYLMTILVVDDYTLNLLFCFPKSWLGCCGGCMPIIQSDAYIIHCIYCTVQRCKYKYTNACANTNTNTTHCTAYIALLRYQGYILVALAT